MSEQQVEVQTMPSSMMEHMKKINPTPTPEVVAETVVETPEVVAEVKPAVTETPVVEAAKEEPKPAVTTETPTTSWLDTEPLAKTEAPKGASFEEKAAAFDKLMENKELQLILTGMQAGKGVQDIIKEYQYVDYNSMSAEVIAEHYGKHLGLDQPQIEESIEGINAMTPIQKQELISSWKEKLNQVQAGKLENTIGSYKQASLNEQAIMQKFNDDIAREAQYIVGQELFGAKLTKDDGDSFQNWVRTEFPKYVNDDGTYNVPMLRNFWIGQKKISAIQKANYAKGATEGRIEVLKEVHRPSESSAVATSLPAAKTVVNDVDKAKQALKSLMGG